MALIYILLITNEVEHHFNILLPNIVFCSVRCLLFCLFSQVFEDFFMHLYILDTSYLLKMHCKVFSQLELVWLFPTGFFWWVKPLSFNVVWFINSSAASPFRSFLRYCSPQFLRDDVSCLLPKHLGNSSSKFPAKNPG